VKKLFCRREFLSQSRIARLYRHFGVEINTDKILLQKLGIRCCCYVNLVRWVRMLWFTTQLCREQSNVTVRVAQELQIYISRRNIFSTNCLWI